MIRPALTAAALVLLAAPASAHHEAMFGPQSSSVLSPGVFLSALVFDKETGRGDDERRETTTVYSVGFKPVKKQPLSMTFSFPVTFASDNTGLEDTVLSARYRLEASRVASSLGFEEGYVMGVAGVEMPTGTFDHPFGKGAFGQIAAGLFSVEKRPIAMIAYVYYHRRGEYDGARDSGNTFAGGGVAYTPIDDEEHGKLFSLQAGVSYERTFQEELHGIALGDTGGSGIFIHPGVVFDLTPTVQMYGLVSLALTQRWNAHVDQQRFRFGTGIIWILKHSGA